MFSLESLVTEFMPHGHCYAWDPLILTMSVTSDAVIALAYFSIPFALMYLVQQRKDLIFSKVFLLFAIFILACGITHVIEIWNVWHGTYGLAAIFKAITAVASIATAFVLYGLIPKAIKIPSIAELDTANQNLLREISARKSAQEEILRLNKNLEDRIQRSNAGQKEATNQFKILAENIPQMVWVTRPDGYVEYFNQQFYLYTGASIDMVRGEGWAKVIHPEDLPKTLEIWRAALTSGEKYSVEYRIRGSNGVYRWFLGLALPVLNDKGDILNWFGTCTDIEDTKK